MHKRFRYCLLVLPFVLGGCPSITPRQAEAVRATFALLLDTFVAQSSEYAGGTAGACVTAARAGDGLHCPATRHASGGDQIEKVFDGTTQVTASVSWAERLALGVGGLDKVVVKVQLNPVESVYHDHRPDTGEVSCNTGYVERIDAVRVSAMAYDSAGVDLSLPQETLFARLQGQQSEYVTETGRYCKTVSHAADRMCAEETEIDRAEPQEVPYPENPFPYPSGTREGA